VRIVLLGIPSGDCGVSEEFGALIWIVLGRMPIVLLFDRVWD
jgi:hypothetical protein